MSRSPRISYPMIRMRRISKLPIHNAVEGQVYTECPPWLEFDDSAYAIEVSDTDVSVCLPRGTLLYLTERREPKTGDTILIDRKDGQVVTRLVQSISQNGFETFYVPSDLKIHHDKINFSDIERVAVVAGTRRT